MNASAKKIGIIHQLQDSGKNIEIAKKDQEIAVSIQNITIGRQISEEEVLYSFPPAPEAKLLLKSFSHKLNPEEFQVLQEIVEIQRKQNPMYGY
jgi:translation initiation factor 5B